MPTACVATSNTLKYPQAGHVWVYLNWALSFRARGWDVTWLDMVEPHDDAAKVPGQLETMRAMLGPFGVDRIAIVDAEGRLVAGEGDLEGDLLFNLRYNLPDDFPARFRRSALVDTDPGMVQYALRHGQMTLPRHDAYLTVGNGRYDADLIATGLTWHPVLPAVALDQWPMTPPPASGPFTTVSHWYMDVWMVDDAGEPYMNDKRTAFEPYLGLPRDAGVAMTLALNLNDDPEEQARLEALGWGVREAHDVGRSLDGYHAFVQASLGEFSCCKPSYRRLNTGWISDRTACYLASGRPCVVEWSGDRDDLVTDAGLLRFKTPDEAAAMLREIADDPQAHATAARHLAERHFDGRTAVDRVLDLVGWQG